MSERLDEALDEVVERALARLGPHLVLGLPLGLGKPNRLTNAFYRRACEDRSVRLDIVTALSLDPPRPRHWLEARLMGPILERLYGPDYPRLAYLEDLRRDQVPANISVTEFYFQSGAALGKPAMQRHYISSNYTHVARDLVDRGINLIAQMVAGPVDGHYSLSCNPDVSLDLKRRLERLPERKTWTIGQVHPALPFMHGDARVRPDFFDEVVDIDPQQPLFGLPRMPVTPQDHAVGFHAARLVADNGTLQIGIGSLSDALVYSLIQRHRNNSAWRAQLSRVASSRLALEDHGTFQHGLFGASEMFMDGFMHLYQAGILKRSVVDDLEQMRRINAGQHEPPAHGALMDAAFFLGSQQFYEFLRGLDEQTRPRFRMHGVGRINQLYGGQEALEIEQRRGARFINTCMMMTLTGAAVSDGLKDQQVVSGVGGQYNFVAMAHAMDDGRSALMLRATRGSGDEATSNIVWEYPHVTIPRHLRDLVVTEYGVADLRGKTDEECIQALIAISDARFQNDLVERARSAGKLARDWSLPEAARDNLPERIEDEFGPAAGFPDYPFGSDFSDLERRLIPALQALKALSGSKPALLGALWRGRPAEQTEALERLGLARPESFRERAYARLVSAVLADMK